MRLSNIQIQPNAFGRHEFEKAKDLDHFQAQLSTTIQLNYVCHTKRQFYIKKKIQTQMSTLTVLPRYGDKVIAVEFCAETNIPVSSSITHEYSNENIDSCVL